jgi:hypothetical protein
VDDSLIKPERAGEQMATTTKKRLTNQELECMTPPKTGRRGGPRYAADTSLFCAIPKGKRYALFPGKPITLFLELL